MRKIIFSLMLVSTISLYAEITMTQIVHATRVETRGDNSEVVSTYTSEVIQKDSVKIQKDSMKIVLPKEPEEEPVDYTIMWKTIFTVAAISLAFI